MGSGKKDVECVNRYVESEKQKVVNGDWDEES